MFATIQLTIVCGMLLALGFIFCLSHKDSQLGTFMTPVVGWALAIFCGLYICSPLDILPEVLMGPFGLPDDLIALAAGIASARAAMKSRKKSSPDAIVPD